MPVHIQRGLGLIGFGLLIGFVGLVLTANLFGVADEHSRRIARSRVARWGGREKTPEEMKHEPAFLLGRYGAGIGFMLIGLLFIGGGVVHLIAPPAE